MRNLLIIDGPSAVGKTTIVNIILNNFSHDFEVAKRLTTRLKRKSEEDLLSYDFITPDEFEKKILDKELIEYKHYLFGMSYGLPKKNVLACLEKDKHAIGIINLGNFRMVKETFPFAFGVFLDTSLETIRRRLDERNIHTEEQINERLENAKKGLAFRKDYNLVIRNEGRSPLSVTEEILNKFNTFNKQLVSREDLTR